MKPYLLFLLALLLPHLACAQIACEGSRSMDGTVVINKSFCGRNGPGECTEWVRLAKRDLGDKFVHATNCGGPSSSDVAGCTLVTTLQITCRTSENLDLTPQSCMDQIGNVITDANMLRNCLSRWAFKERGIEHHEDLKMQNFAELHSFDNGLKKTYECSLKGFHDRDQCLYDLALETHDARLCSLIEDPYPSGPAPSPLRKSKPTCVKNVLQVEKP